MKKDATLPARRPWYFIFTFLWTIYGDLWCWLAIVLVRLFQGQRLHGIDWSFWVETRTGTWLAKKMQYVGVTLGRGGILRTGKAGDLEKIDQPVEFHEHRHVHQYQVTMLISTVYTLYNYFLCGASEWSLLGLPVGGVVAYLCAMLVAKLRGERWYRDNIFEASAYAQTELWAKAKEFVHRFLLEEQKKGSFDPEPINYRCQVVKQPGEPGE